MAKSNEIQEALLQAIDIIASKRAKENNAYDQTIICTIVDNSHAEKQGYYTVTNDTITFDAYSENTEYKVGAFVRVSIPNGDYSQQKYITGLYSYNDGAAINYVAPLDTFLDAATLVDNRASQNGLVNGVFAVAANNYKEECIPVGGKHSWSDDSHFIQLQKNGIYDTIGLQADFKCLLGKYDMRGGSYGLRLDLEVALNNNNNGKVIHSLFLDSSNFFGNPYDLPVYSTQTQVYDISKIGEIQGITLYLYQKGFTYYDGTTIKSINPEDDDYINNIFVSNIYVALGSDLYKVPNNTVRLYTKDSSTYKYFNPTETTNIKTLSVLWYNKDTENGYVGFSDGLYHAGTEEDPLYDEIEYLDKVRENNRLVAQQSVNVRGDVASLDAAARMSEVTPLFTQLTDLIESEFIRRLINFNFQMSGCAPAQEYISDWVNKCKELKNDFISESGSISTYVNNIKSKLKPLKEGENEVDLNGISSNLINKIKSLWYITAEEDKDNNYNKNLFMITGGGEEFSFAPGIAKMTAQGYSYPSYRGIYFTYRKYISKAIAQYNELLNKIELLLKIDENNYIENVIGTGKDFISQDFSLYDNNYSLYWYRYDPTYNDPSEPFMESGWRPIVDENGKRITVGLPRIENSDNKGYLIAKCPEEENRFTVELDSATKKEKFRVVICYNHNVYYSDIVEFTNEDEFTDGNEFYKVEGLYLEHGDESYENYQTFYLSSNSIISPRYEQQDRAIKLCRKQEYGGQEALIGAQVYWYIPTSTTMLNYSEEYLKTKGYMLMDKNADTSEEEGSKYYENGYACFFKTIEKVEDCEFFYRIKGYHTSTAMRNIIKCKVVQDELEIDLDISMIFGTLGTCGTDYTLSITPATNQICISEKNETLPLIVNLYNYNNELVEPDGTIFEGNYTFSWFGGSGYIAEADENEKNKVIIKRNSDSTSRAGILKVTTNIIVEAKTEENRLSESRVIELSAFYPIAFGYTAVEYKDSVYIDGPTTIIYDSSGGNPNYNKIPYKLYNNNHVAVNDINWSIEWYDEDGNKIEQPDDSPENADAKKAFDFYKRYMPVLKEGNMLLPSNMYIENCNCYPVVVAKNKENNFLLWAQPILIIQNRYPSAMLNNWDGSFQIDENSGTILSTLVGAGKKESDNTFSGVLMGEVSSAQTETPPNDVLLYKDHSGQGIYGFHHGGQSFGFNVDGSAFIGKSGGGRISFEGEYGFIYSANWLTSFIDQGKRPFSKDADTGSITLNEGNAGMAIDLQNGHIDAYNFKLTSKGIYLNSDPKLYEYYFKFGDEKNYISYQTRPGNEGGNTLKINVQSLAISNTDIGDYVDGRITTDSVFNALKDKVEGFIIDEDGNAYVQASYLHILDDQEKTLFLANGKDSSRQVQIAGWNVTDRKLTASGGNVNDGGKFHLKIQVPSVIGEPGTGEADFITLGIEHANGTYDWPFVVSSSGRLKAYNVDIKGIIKSNEGYIGNWNISSFGIHKEVDQYKIDLYSPSSSEDEDQWIFVFTDGGKSGEDKFPFIIQKNGKLKARGVDIRGRIEANEGTIAGWILDAKGFCKYQDSGTGSDDLSIPARYIGQENSVFLLPEGSYASFPIGGFRNVDWVFTIGNSFGLTKSGDLYVERATFFNGGEYYQYPKVSINKREFGYDYLFMMNEDYNWFDPTSNNDVGYGLNIVPNALKFYIKKPNSQAELSCGIYHRDSDGITGHGELTGTWVIYKQGESSPITSDKNNKNSISPQSEIYSEVFDKLNPVTFKYNHGTSNRLHMGLIAQEIEEALVSTGLDSKNFAVLCYDIDEDGNKTNYGIRYEELISMNIYEIQKLKSRVKELEARLNI